MDSNKDSVVSLLTEIQETVTFIKDHAVTQDEFGELKNEVGELKNEVSELKKEVTSIRTDMVTKDYMDTKLADFRGDLVVLMRKEDGKLRALIERLRKKQVLDDAEAKEILTLEPFPQLF